MSYIALATDQFDAVTAFYREALGFPVVDKWDRADARGVRFDLGGMRLEILDNGRKDVPLLLGAPADRVHIAIEVENIDTAYSMISIAAPAPKSTSWGARLFELRDPDGIPITFLQWTTKDQPALREITGRLTTGLGLGKHFTRIDWAREQFKQRVGIDPYPGTANVRLDDPASLAVWTALRQTSGIAIDNPNNGPRDCDARCFHVRVDGKVDAAIVLPDVDGYAENQIEIIAPVGLRDALGKVDGDNLVLQIK